MSPNGAGCDGRVIVPVGAFMKAIFARRVDRGPGVSPLHGAGLWRFASSRCRRPSVSPLSGCHPSRGLADMLHAVGVQLVAGLRPGGLAGALADAAIKAALHRKAQQPEYGEVAGVAGRADDSGPFPCPGIAGSCFLHAARERRARLTN